MNSATFSPLVHKCTYSPLLLPCRLLTATASTSRQKNLLDQFTDGYRTRSHLWNMNYFFMAYWRSPTFNKSIDCEIQATVCTDSWVTLCDEQPSTVLRVGYQSIIIYMIGNSLRVTQQFTSGYIIIIRFWFLHGVLHDTQVVHCKVSHDTQWYIAEYHTRFYMTHSDI